MQAWCVPAALLAEGVGCTAMCWVCCHECMHTHAPVLEPLGVENGAHCPCREIGKVMTGRLVVVTPDRQHTFIVKGRQPAYVPPSREKLPTGTYLTAGTASTSARFGMQQISRSTSPAYGQAGSRVTSAAQHNSSLAGAGRTGAASCRAGTAGRNYLQQNIRAAKHANANSSDAGSGDGVKKSSAEARPWS